MLVQEYPVTTPYGQVPGYPLHNGFHQGVDYGCPVGTPVIVNGITIGLSGNTGYSSGAHCHVGKWVNGVVQNPLNGGFNFSIAKVTEVNEDPQNGKYVRVQGDGASWVYCHLSDNGLVQVGKELKGADMPYIDQAVLDGLEAWKRTGQQLSFDPAYPAMGGTPGEPLRGDTSGITIVMDDFRKNKEQNLAKPTNYKQLEEPVYVKA